MNCMWKSTREAFPGSSALISLQPLLPLQAPRFPTFAELVEQDRMSSTSQPSKREGLFSALISDPRVLLADLLDSPDKYEPGLADLVQDLVSGQKNLQSLTPMESELLDRSVIDFTRPKITKPAELPRPVVPKRAPEPEADTLEAAETPLPPGMADAYWWLR